jgi:hypothetical protein
MEVKHILQNEVLPESKRQENITITSLDLIATESTDYKILESDCLKYLSDGSVSKAKYRPVKLCLFQHSIFVRKINCMHYLLTVFGIK